MKQLLTLALAGILLTIPRVSADESAKKAPAPKIEPDIVYGHKHGLAMTMDLYHPDGKPNQAAILFMMSGGWVSRWAPPERTRPLFAPYLAKGFKVFAVRHGSSPRYSIPEAVSDVRRAVRFVHGNAKRYGVDTKRLGVMGMSAGGHLALMLGTTGDDGEAKAKDPMDRNASRVAAVAALVPPTDLRVAVWDAPESLPAYREFPALNLDLKKAGTHSPLTHVTSDDAPALVIMGAEDELVPPRHGEWIAEAFKKKDVRHKLMIIPDAGHDLGGQKNLPTVVDEVVSWFEEHLGAPSKN